VPAVLNRIKIPLKNVPPIVYLVFWIQWMMVVHDRSLQTSVALAVPSVDVAGVPVTLAVNVLECRPDNLLVGRTIWGILARLLVVVWEREKSLRRLFLQASESTLVPIDLNARNLMYRFTMVHRRVVNTFTSSHSFYSLERSPIGAIWIVSHSRVNIEKTVVKSKCLRFLRLHFERGIMQK